MNKIKKFKNLYSYRGAVNRTALWLSAVLREPFLVLRGLPYADAVLIMLALCSHWQAIAAVIDSAALDATPESARTIGQMKGSPAHWYYNFVY